MTLSIYHTLSSQEIDFDRQLIYFLNRIQLALILIFLSKETFSLAFSGTISSSKNISLMVLGGAMFITNNQGVSRGPV